MESSPRFRWIALTLIILATAGRLLYLAWHCPLDLAPDEAHYWDWARHLDWSYYSKGPLVAWLIRLSCELFGPLSNWLAGDDMLAIRLPAVVCGSLLLAGLYVLTVQVHQSEKLACAVVALALTLPIVAAGSALMTIDAPFACCWMWALVFAHHAIFRAAGWAWPLAGVCVLLGVLSKYTMVLWLPSLVLFLATTPALRGQLRQRGFWVLTGIGALGGVPILAWNAGHDWVTLKHMLGWHVGLADDQLIHWLGPLHYLGAQFAVLLGFWFVVWARAVWTHRPTREARPQQRFLWWMSVPTFVFFWLFSWKNGGGAANWPLAGYLSGIVLGAGWLAQQGRDPRPWYRLLTQACTLSFAGLGLLLLLVIHEPLRLQPVLLQLAGPASAQRPAPIRRVDPTSRLRGWRYLAAEVDRVRGELKARGIEPVLATERWIQTAELRFYCQGQPVVYCLGSAVGDRHSQYDLWRPNPVADAASYQGQTFLLVGTDTAPLCRFFAWSEPTRVIQYRENGQLVQEWTLTIAYGFRGFGSEKVARQY